MYAENNLARYNSVLVTFNYPLTKDMKKRYEKKIESITYAKKLSYYFYGKIENIDKLYNDVNIRKIEEIDYTDKIQNSLKKEMEVLDKSIELKVLLFKIYSNKKFLLDILGKDIKILNIDDETKIITIKIVGKNIDQLLKSPLVHYVEKSSQKLEIKSKYIATSTIAAKVSRANTLWDDPYSLSGKNISVAVIDEGRIRATHQEFNQNGSSKIHTLVNNGYVQAHSTHVAGIIGSMGINPDAHGMANNVDIYSYYFYDFAFAKAMKKAIYFSKTQR
jgi:23S rRNA pseudoU1915 N3-methylase RlmH